MLTLKSRYGGPATRVLIAVSCLALSGFGGEAKKNPHEPIPLTVPKAKCGPNDNPETALQGQVPAALRAAGFKGFNCNLELIGQSRGDGANWQATQFKEGKQKAGNGNGNGNGHGQGNKDERICAYHGTAFTTEGRTHVGVPVIDITDPSNPTPTTYLTTTSMLDPWESLKVNERRQLLAADNAKGGGFSGAGGPEIDIYDLSGDCRFPQLLSSIAVGKADGSTGIPFDVIGHEGAWAPDGLTYYGADLVNNGGQYYAVDTVDPTAPKLISVWSPRMNGGGVHGMSISDDGNRGYFVSTGGLVGTPIPDLTDPNAPLRNGLLIYDLTDIQARKPGAQPRLISSVLWKDGAVAQHTIPVKISGKPYIIFVDEAGSGGFQSAAQQQAACAANLPPFPMARIIDISDESAPRVISKLMHEVHDPANCSRVLPDLVGLTTFTYGTHYCSVDNKHNATTLACGMFNSGIRVFDIRDPARPKEIAYYNPAGTDTPSPGSNHRGNWSPGGPDWCSAQVHLDAERGTLWTTCQDNGLLMLRFTNGVWPFPQSKTPAGQQN